jgi:Rrf2 family protein
MSLDNSNLYTTNELFEKLNIPFRYLRKQMNFLQKQGLLQSIQGKQGGYQIAKPLNQITLMDIVESTNELVNENKCFFGFQDCPLTERCSMHDKWGEVRDATVNLLKTTTLMDLNKDNAALKISLK